MSATSGSPAQRGQADETQDTVNGYVLVGEKHIIIARPWKHGEQTGLTPLKIFAETSGYQDFEEFGQLGLPFPEVSSESLAADLADGHLIKLDSPVPVPVPGQREKL
jgi:hypothetical protein